MDSNVLLDILTADPVWFALSARHVARLAVTGELVINQLIYAEISVGFLDIETLDNSLADAKLVREDLPWDAAFLAGKAFRSYRRRGGRRASPLPDFYIGAHAAIRGYALLTRDPTRFRGYFPSVEILAPE